MNNKSYVNSAARVRQRPHKFRRLVKRHRGTTKVIAVSLAFIMAFSMLGANITSIVNLIEAYADHTDNYKQVNNQYVYYTTDLTLYDYKTDSEIKGGSDNNAYDGWNRNSIFNRALYETGYSQVARNGNQWPLYLGLQYPYQKLGNQMIKASGNPYNYSIVVNSEAGTNDNDAGSSGAAIGQVDSKLYDGDITQGGGKVILPYFDEEFLTANLSKVLSAETITSENLDDYKTTSLGSVLKNQKFKFIKYTDGYYKYLSAYDKLTYSGDTFTVGSGGQVYDLSWKNQNGTTHSSKPAFFPYSTKAGSSSPTFGYGAKFEIPFTMSADGKTVTRDSTTGAVTATGVDDIKFKFSGDDDVWVFIDGYLVLDVGGAHGKVSGEINFNKNNPSAHTAAVKGTGYDMQDGKSSVNTSGYSTPGISNLFNNTLKLYSDSTKQHMLTVYYIERGSLESNCEISFNFQIADIVTVANKLNTDDVNSFFLDDTKAVADTEAVEYVMSSNSATSGTTPDKTETTVTDNQKGYVTLSFDTGGNGDIDSKKVIQGTQVVLPKGYKLNKPGYRIKGWSKSSGGTVVNAFSPYTVNTTHTLYAVWEKIPISPMEEPPEPTLVYICSNGKYITSVGFSNYGTIEEGWQYLANMTSVDMSATHYHVRLVSKTGTENNGDNRDHPADNSAYSLDNSTVSNVTYKDNADLVMAESGGFWRWKITGEYSSEVKKYKDYSTYVNNDNDRKLHVGTDYSANQWVEDYYDKYNTLKTYCQAYKYTTNTDIRSKYKTAVEKYKNLKYNDSNTADQYNTAIGNLVSAINTYNQNYTTQYYYSNGAEEYAEFYVFSSTTPTVTPDNHYGTYADNNSDTSCNLITVTKLEQGEVPEGHAEPADATGKSGRS